MIEFKVSGRDSFWKKMVVDGEELESSEVVMAGEGTWFGSINDPVDSKRILLVPLHELASIIFRLDMHVDDKVDRWIKLHNIILSYPPPTEPLIRDLLLILRPDFDNWTNPFSSLDYLETFKKMSDDSFLIDVELGADVTEGFKILYALSGTEKTITAAIEPILEEVKRISASAAEAVLRTIRKNSLVTWFNFPVSIKTSCEQYLIYFVQFLEDLGIKANSEIKEDAGRILFSVTPADGPSALGKIREALEAYLDLPRNPEFNEATEGFSDVAVSQLKANVFFLKSQLTLAQAMLEAKNATIEALNFTIYQQRQLQTGSLLSESAKETVKDSEPIIGDTVHLTKFEGKFLKVDLPTILRRLKRSFGIGEKDSETKS